MLISDFLNFIIAKTDLLRSRGDLYKVWEFFSRADEFKISSLFSEISEYYQEEFGEEKDFYICEKCLGIFFGKFI